MLLLITDYYFLACNFLICRGMNWAEHRPPLGGFNHLLLTNEAHHCAADSSGETLRLVTRLSTEVKLKRFVSMVPVLPETNREVSKYHTIVSAHSSGGHWFKSRYRNFFFIQPNIDTKILWGETYQDCPPMQEWRCLCRVWQCSIHHLIASLLLLLGGTPQCY